MTLRLVATCSRGLSDLVGGELGEIAARDVRPNRGAVAFAGGWEDVWRANWRLRTANRVLVELGTWTAKEDEDLAAGAARLVEGETSWDGMEAGVLFHPRRTFAIRASSFRSRITDRRWIALKTKDGIVDAQRRRFGRRSSIDREHPELSLRLRLARDRATLLLDTSGLSLDHRSYRLATGTAPVREHLAAAVVLAAGWDGRGPVVDPMCGSGTLLAEGGAWALGLAPGRHRDSWGFETLPSFDPRAWEAIKREPIPAPADGLSLHGLDLSPSEVEAARANLGRAGLGDRATVELGDGFAYDPPEGPGLVVVNPPYGERLDGEREQWSRLGDLLKQRYPGWRAAILAGGETLGKHIGLRPTLRLPVWNGPLETRILVFDLY